MHNQKNRLQFLAGIINEDVSLRSNAGGRSDSNSLSFFVESYLLNLAQLTINALDALLKSNNIKATISQKDTKIQENSFSTQLNINNKDYLLTFLVSFDQGGNTASTVSYDGKTEQFNLNTRHSQNDVNLFIKEIVQRIQISLTN